MVPFDDRAVIPRSIMSLARRLHGKVGGDARTVPCFLSREIALRVHDAVQCAGSGSDRDRMLKRQEQHAFVQPIERVVACWTDAVFLTGMMEAQGSRDVGVTVVRAAPGEIHVTIARQVPVKAPALIRSVIGSWLTLTQNDIWQQHADGSWTAERHAKPKGLAAEGAARIRLVPMAEAGTGCAADISVSSRAPMVADMVEKLMLDDSTKLLIEEFAWIDAHG